MDDALGNVNDPNYTYPSFPNVSKHYDNVSEDMSSHDPSDDERDVSFRTNFITVTFFTEVVISVFGTLGNGVVIWFLGFCIERNPFSTYILNLAIADLGVLLSVPVNTFSLWFTSIPSSDEISLVSQYLALLMYSASQFLLTAISIDRCVAVFFPLWHRCKRPPHLSTVVCALIWVLSFLLTSISYVLIFLNLNETTTIGDSYQLIANAVLCLPVMTIATVSLFIRVFLKAGQHRRGRLLTIVLLTLLFFLLFAFPYNVMKVLSDHNYVPEYTTFVTGVLACLNSSVNPVIYFLVGRRWKSRRRESVKMILQKVFKEEKGYTDETPV
ncbi:PREDICTED: mas-related G-protein coupled receptor member A1-like [Gekko japonicus]|uniref:Mas-related G-protein coupled receptor member A1-like n=1 Tax=Gekko japonicus TaxID=146911 RepID=A0ABM1KH31_GEKJA|nr:PREDICTED: mas-related G-protein coupled receptor member A1-like [Gekko japonicus]